MALIAVLAVGLAIWAIATGKIEKPDSRQMVAIALAGLGLAMLGRAKPMAGVVLVAAGAALWPWNGGKRSRSISRPMTAGEARGLLGVTADADAETIRAAHRRLISQLHPDRGGTEALASQINRARDIALSALSSHSFNEKPDSKA